MTGINPVGAGLPAAQPAAAQPQAANPAATVAGLQNQVATLSAQAGLGAGAGAQATNGASAHLQHLLNGGNSTAVPVNTTTLAGGITSLTSIVSTRQQRLAQLSVAIAADADSGKTLNTAALAALNQEASMAQSLNDQTRKLFDSLERTIQAWTRQ